MVRVSVEKISYILYSVLISVGDGIVVGTIDFGTLGIILEVMEMYYMFIIKVTRVEEDSLIQIKM